MDNNGFVFTPKEGGIGMPNQVQNMEFNMSAKMKRGAQAQIFDNNGGNSKAGDAGTVNKNSEYGPITYGF